MRARRASKIYILFFEKQFVIYARSLFLNLNKANCKLSLKCSIFFHSRQYIGRLDSKTVKDKFAILHFLFRRLKTKDERERKVSQQKFACCKRVWVVLILMVIFKKCGYSLVKKIYISEFFPQQLSESWHHYHLFTLAHDNEIFCWTKICLRL